MQTCLNVGKSQTIASRRVLRVIALASLALVVGLGWASAQEMKRPRISQIAVDWDAARAELNTLDALAPGLGAAERLASLNHALAERFAGIAASPVPVLLPFDTASFLRDHLWGNGIDAGERMPPASGDYLSGFQGVPFFHAGPAGYDAVILVRAQDVSDLGIRYSAPIYVHISGSSLLYELGEPAGVIGWRVTGGLEAEFPGIRRLFLEANVRYTFVRYGVPYHVSIECFDGGARFRKISCRDADKIATRLLKSLRLAGGAPGATEHRAAKDVEADTIERPAARSSVFTYHGPGNLLPGTGFKGRTGVADYTVYSKIRFPLADAPAFANSQSFMNWGNCEATGQRSAGRQGKAAAYHCRVNSSQRLVRDESAPDNYSYPWRDNFCEHRFFFVGQCPGGFGHQGQDIRPSSCKQRVSGANRCEPYQHDVVAVRDGVVLRAAGQHALHIMVNAPNERIRFRYLHMAPKQVDADGMVSGRLVREGEVIGRVGNFFKRERATTYHLHFDVQVPTKYGWVFINPYMTLIAAYERLIRGRGQELKEESDNDLTASIPPVPPVPAASSPASEPMEPAASAATIAAKPTESPVESPSSQKLNSEMER